MEYGWCNLRQFMQSPKRYLKAVMLALKLNDRFPWMRVRNLARVAAAAMLAKHLAEKKVTHVHVHFAFGAAGVAIFLREMCGISYSISIHGSDVLLPQPLLEEKLKRSTFIISNCDYHIRNLQNHYSSLEKKQFYLVRLGIDMNAGLWSPAEHEQGFQDLKILNIARLDPVKDHETLIRACVLLKKKKIAFKLKIIGDGPLMENISHLIGRLRLTDEIELLGRQYEKEVSEWIGWSHVVVLSSRSEGTPMTIIEAMARARAVIAPNITALPEMIDHPKTGYLFQSGDETALSECLAQLASNPATIRSMGAAGREKAVALFTIEQNMLQLQSIFTEEGCLENI